LLKKGDSLEEIPQIFFHVSYSFHKWFLYHRGDFDFRSMDNLKNKVIQFEKLWTDHEEKALKSIPIYVGALWPFKEIHVYCFESPEYYAVPCISDPVSINMDGENLHLWLLYLIHELVHLIMQFDQHFSNLSRDEQEATAYFVGNTVLEDILGENAIPIIKAFTIPWPYDFPRIAKEFEGKINLEKNTILNLINKGILGKKNTDKI